jgi:hypothetical protein
MNLVKNGGDFRHADILIVTQRSSGFNISPEIPLSEEQ